MKPRYVWNQKHMKKRTHVKLRNLWSPKSYETTKPLKPSSKHMKPWNHGDHETFETMKPVKPSEAAKLMKPRNLWTQGRI